MHVEKLVEKDSVLKIAYNVIKSSNIIKTIIKSNKKSPSFSFITFYNKALESGLRVAFIAPKKMGTAVERNFAKRRFRAVFRNLTKKYNLIDTNLVFIANRNILNLNFLSLENEFFVNLRKLQIINDSID